MDDSKELDISQIKHYICKVCLELDKPNLISILNFLKKEHIDNSFFNQNNDGIKSIITKDQLMNKENYKKILIYLNDGCDLLIVNGINGVIFNKCIICTC